MKRTTQSYILGALALYVFLASCQSRASVVPQAIKRAAAVTSASGLHMLDDTGCEAMPAGDYWNRPVDSALVASNSLADISYAASIVGNDTPPNLNANYTYEVVPPDALLTVVQPSSGHATPANNAPPELSGWPVPPDMAALLTTADHVSVLIQQTNPPGDCRGWDGYNFTGSGSNWSAYSGDHLEMNSNMYSEVCNGVAALCGEDIEGDLTYYELNANTGNASGVVTTPILHALHTEMPCAVAGTCRPSPPPNALSADQCGTNCARLRLNPALLARPSDPNAAAVYDALVHYGMDISENGCCWGFYTMVRADDPTYPTTAPTAVSAFMSSLRITQFDVLQNGSW